MPVANASQHPVAGAGLGFRRALMPELRRSDADGIDFFELAPENWIHAGGTLARDLRHFTERHPFVAHGLSLSLGGPAPLDEELLRDIRAFLDRHRIRAYTEHLSYCSDDGHLYDLMPIPFTDEAVRWVAARIRRAQEILERPIAVENVSYYAAPGARMTEIEFLRAVLDEADCGLLLDVNNIFVNAINHGYDARQFLHALPAPRICYFHVAGHYVEAPDLRVDTHGAGVCPDVWSLLDEAFALFGPVPTLLERDFNFPPLPELVREVADVRARQQRARQQQLRDPDRVPAPADIEPRRMAIYRELFFNNLVDLLGGAFPVARRILGPDCWRRLVRNFYAGHHAHTPYFLELPREFADWLRARDARAGDEPAFLEELAHYEWVELALSISEEVPPAASVPRLSPLDQPLAVSPLAWPLAYRWPVHRLSPEFQPANPPELPTFLVVYRDAGDTVQFLEIGAETARLLDVLEQAPGMTGRTLLAGQAAASDAGAAHAAQQALADLLRRGVLVIAALDRSVGA